MTTTATRAAAAAAAAPAPPPDVHALLVDELARIGAVAPDAPRPPRASSAAGTTRLAFSRADRAGREWLRRTALERFGARAARVDGAGNQTFVFGGRADDDDDGGGDDVAVVLGSHIDTVRAAGAFDGTLGVVAGLAAAAAATAAVAGAPAVHVVAFADEEGTMLGSNAWSGVLDVDRDLAGVRPAPEVVSELGFNDDDNDNGNDDDNLAVWRAALAGVGGDLDALRAGGGAGGGAAAAAANAAYLEVHIEQGPELVRDGVDCGVVQAIVGLRTSHVTFAGRTSHAGATAMPARADALVAAAAFITAVHDTAMRHDAAAPERCAVATVGRCVVTPGGASAVPGRVDLTVDARAADAAALAALDDELRAALRAIEAAHAGVRVPGGLRLDHAAAQALMDASLQAQLTASARATGRSVRAMASRAGHDAQNVSRALPRTAMLFVPSDTGVSHTPEEWSTPEHVATAVDVLTHAVTQLLRDAALARPSASSS